MPEKVQIHRFVEEGLTVLHEPADGPLVSFCLSIGAGSRFDGPAPGLAHLAEHMLFQGTDALDQFALNRRAAELGGGHNACTGYDTISIQFESFPEGLEGALDLLFEQFYRTCPAPDRLRKEKRIVLDEIRSVREDPCENLGEAVWREFWEAPVGTPIAGDAASVRAIRVEEITAHLRRHFVNANAVLAVVGDVDRARLRRAIRARVDPRRRGARRRAARPRPGEGRALRRRASRGGQSHVQILREIDPRPRPFLAVEIALDLVGADPDSRLFQAIREDHGLGYDVSAEAEWGRGFGAAMIAASAGPGEASRLAGVIEAVLRRSVEEGFSDADLERARHKRRFDHASLAERRMDRAMARAESELTGFPSLEEARAILEDLRHDEIQQAWRQAVEGRGLTALRAG